MHNIVYEQASKTHYINSIRRQMLSKCIARKRNCCYGNVVKVNQHGVSHA